MNSKVKEMRLMKHYDGAKGTNMAGTVRKDENKMNENKNNEKQFEAAGKRRIVLDGIPYTVMVFLRIDTRETGMDKIMELAKREIATNPLQEG